MIQIKEEVYNSLLLYSEKKYPVESCGIVLIDKNLIYKFLPIDNISSKRHSYKMHPNQFNKIMNTINKTSDIGLFHSHPFDYAVPSEADIENMKNYKGFYLLILSLLNINKQLLKSFKIYNDEYIEEEIRIFNE